MAPPQPMDPHLWELLEEGDGDDEVAAILRLGQPGTALPEGVIPRVRFGDIATVLLKRRDIAGVRADPAVTSMKPPQPLAPEPEVTPPGPPENLPEQIDRFDSLRPTDESSTGRGVVVGVVDWGCDFAHPDLRHPDGSTRLLGLWDQGADPASGASNRYGYGRIYSAEAIDRASKADDPYAALGYHPADSDPDQNGSHGTHVMGIAAGVAPGADLVFVQHSRFGRDDTERLGDSVTLLEAVDFIFRTAGERPCVVNLSMGSHGGQHDGLSLVEQGLDAALRERPGRAIAQSAGNYYHRQCHTSDQLRPGEERNFVWEISASDVTPNELEVWYSGRDVFVVEVRSPDGSLVRRVALGERASLSHEGKEIGRVYHRAHEPNNLDHHMDILLYTGAPAGSWSVALTAQDVVDGRFHAWIERDAVCPDCQSRFRPEDAIPSSTTGTIANGLRTLAVGAYDPHSLEREVAPFSSCGPTRDGRLKPDLIAPGVSILSARSAPRGKRDETTLLTRKSGTSMASPHVAGTIALMFEVAPRPLRIEETRNLLLASTRPASIPLEQAERMGSGYLDMDGAIRVARRIGETLRPQQRIRSETMESESQSAPTGASDAEIVEPVHEDSKSRERFVPEAERDLSPPAITDQGMQGQPREPGPVLVEDSEYAGASAPPDHTDAGRGHNANPPTGTYVAISSGRGEQERVGRFDQEEGHPEQGTSVPWNVYMYVVGTDRQGRGDFNVMRQQLQQETTYEYPWVAITFDFNKGKDDPTKGELRKRWRQSASSRPFDEKPYPLGTTFDIVYSDIEALSENNQQIRQLHFLTHFGNDTIWFRPYTGSPVARLNAVAHQDFASAFASDAVVKIHGCQQDTELTSDIEEFCTTSTASRRLAVLRAVRSRIETSYPFQLARLIDRPVWATPMGSFAIYECLYLDLAERGKRFCVETFPFFSKPPVTPERRRESFSFQRTLRFYQANYGQIFDRAPAEAIFDSTFHMKYKPRLRSGEGLLPVPCSTDLRPGGVAEHDTEQVNFLDGPAYRDVGDEVDVSALVERVDDAISAGALSPLPDSLFGYVLSEAGMDAPGALGGLPPALVFDALTTERHPGLRSRIEQAFRVVAPPLSPLDRRLRPGDLMIRRAHGEGNLAHVAMLVSGEVVRAEGLEASGLRPENFRRGDYAHVVEAGAFPHKATDNFARRLSREDGRLERDTIILQLRTDGTSTHTPRLSRPPAETIDVERAVRLNRQYGLSLGWQVHIDRIVNLLGFANFTPTEEQLALAVAGWQSRQRMQDDGVIGPATWARMSASLGLAQPAPTPAGGLASFTVTPPAPQQAPVPATPTGPPAISDLRRRIVQIAHQEWDRWGRGARTETDPDLRPILLGYWQTVLSRQDAERAIDSKDPWSAVFISWVMRQAGAGQAFAYSTAHYAYISAAKRAHTSGDASKFWTYDITEARPEVGDLVCRDRKNEQNVCHGTTYATVDNGTRWRTHSDIVTEVGNGHVSVIGGNVGGPRCAKNEGCTVHTKRVRIDGNGLVVPDQGGCSFFAIVKVR